MTLNGVMALTFRYFTKFGKPAFQLLTASSSIELIVHSSMHLFVCLHTLFTYFTLGKIDPGRLKNER